MISSKEVLALTPDIFNKFYAHYGKDDEYYISFNGLGEGDNCGVRVILDASTIKFNHKYMLDLNIVKDSDYIERRNINMLYIDSVYVDELINSQLESWYCALENIYMDDDMYVGNSYPRCWISGGDFCNEGEKFLLSPTVLEWLKIRAWIYDGNDYLYTSFKYLKNKHSSHSYWHETIGQSLKKLIYDGIKQPLISDDVTIGLTRTLTSSQHVQFEIVFKKQPKPAINKDELAKPFRQREYDIRTFNKLEKILDKTIYLLNDTFYYKEELDNIFNFNIDNYSNAAFTNITKVRICDEVCAKLLQVITFKKNMQLYEQFYAAAPISSPISAPVIATAPPLHIMPTNNIEDFIMKTIKEKQETEAKLRKMTEEFAQKEAQMKKELDKFQLMKELFKE